VESPCKQAKIAGETEKKKENWFGENMKAKMIMNLLTILILLSTPLAGCLGPGGHEGSDNSEPDYKVTVLTYDVFALSDAMLSDFTNRTGIEVEIIKVDDTGTVLARALQTKDDPIADVIIGIDNSFLQIALDNDLFKAYKGNIPDLHPEASAPYSGNLVVPYDWGRVCINYDTTYVDGENVTAPTSLWDFTNETWAGKVVVQNPRTSSPGRSFMLATVDYFANDADDSTDFTDWWSAMKANDVIVTDSWTEAYETHYSGGYGQWYDGFIGNANAVVSYCHSPGVEAYYGENGTTSVALTLDRASFLQVEYAGIANGAAHPIDAEAFIQELLANGVQSTIATTNFMYPADVNYTLPEDNGYLYHTGVPNQDSNLTAAEIAAGIEDWLNQWDSAMA
jgi:thiamine transport system substrate-binding protein